MTAKTALAPAIRHRVVKFISLGCRLLATALVLAAGPLPAAPPPGNETAPTRGQTLDQDLRGPRVEWTGLIVDRVQDGEYTCFVLSRSLDERVYLLRPDRGQGYSSRAIRAISTRTHLPRDGS